MKDKFKALERALEKDLENYANKAGSGGKLTPQSSGEIASQSWACLL